VTMTKQWIRRIVIIALLVAAGWALRVTVFRPEPVPVTIFRVATGLVEENVTNSKAGTVMTRQRASLSPEIGGRVAELPVREGDRIRKGQVLMRIADADYRARLEARARALEVAGAGREETCTAARQAEKDLARYIRLAREEIVSQELLDQFQSRRDSMASACDGARSRVLEAGAARDLARIDLSRTILRAPFDGVIAEVSTELGEWITPSPPGLPIPPVIEILNNNEIYVSAPLDEVDVGRVDVGQTVRITLDAFPGESFPGQVSRVAPYILDIEEQNRTFEIEVEFEDQEFASTIPPGASADVEVILEISGKVLRIPSYALIEGSRVLVLQEEHLVSREVETGLSNWEFTEITAGLDEGEKVVVSLDRLEVQEGAFARVESETLK